MEPLGHYNVDTVQTHVSHLQPHSYKMDKSDPQEGSLGAATIRVRCACEKVVASDLWLRVDFSMGTPVSSSTYNWLVKT